MEKDPDAAHRLNLLYRVLHTYESRLVGADPGFMQGSPLALDGDRSTVLQPGHRAYLHLRSTYEFLDSIGRLVQAKKTFSPLGVEQAMGRTALLAACKALYLLEPDDSDERFRRCAALALEDDKSSLREVRDALAVVDESDPIHKTFTDWREKLRCDQSGILEEVTRLGLTPVALKGDGELFGIVARYLDRVSPLPQPDDVRPTKSVSYRAILMRYWNQTSGYAHAHTWPLLRIAESAPGTNQLTVAANIADVIGLLTMIWDVFDNAMSLLQQRG
ncbi:hypothetical protein [Myceligenerans xiligouense]|uniref:hypothetical protein n=1 Tax=Myceligenerans xiligouense TaxID=253184 RepID=UPI0014773F3C|nr:hypothetical protein [Myceligenerans xiligouense]